jgi:3-carboxy-cis,cis-muconate cycloisomerase
VDEHLTRTWFDTLFTTDAMRRVFADRTRLQAILDFEAALAKSLAMVGIAPARAAETIASQCRAELFDLSSLSKASRVTGNSAIPVIHELESLVAQQSEEAARYVHFGATSQDAMDTGLVLQIRDALDVMTWDLEYLSIALEGLANKHKHTPMVGRTWLQQAVPMTFGLKVVGWLSAVARHQERIGQIRAENLVLQLGGAAGTLAAFGEQHETVVALVGQELHLGSPRLPWHTHRDRLAEVATTLGLLTGTLGKIARDVSLLSQAEIAEVAEPNVPGRGGSSSMPQKQNPVGCAVALAAATRVPPLVSTMLAAMPQEHERGLGGWQAEWETLPEIFELSAGALAQVRQIIAGLTVNVDQMRKNIDAGDGLLYAEAVAAALALKVGRTAAHSLVGRACRRTIEEGRNLRELLVDNPEVVSALSITEINELFELDRHTSAAAQLVEKALSRWHFQAESELPTDG